MMQMDARKRWMYDVDRRTSEYMANLKKFLDVAEANRVNNLCLVHLLTVGMSQSTLKDLPFIATWLGRVSCPAIIVGPSTEKEGL